MKSKWKLKSNVKITVRDLGGSILEVVEKHNLITTVGLGMIIDLLNGSISDGEIKYMAVGTDNTAPALANVALGTEVFRKIPTTQVEDGVTSLVTTVYLAPTEAVAAIEELGWFAGVGAGAGADSGVMVARVLYSRNKTNIESIKVTRTDTISEA